MKTKDLLKKAMEYRALAARLNYLALDRLHLQYIAKCISECVATTCQHDWIVVVKTVAKYVLFKPRLVQLFKWPYIDRDRAGDRETRKSTGGGLIMMRAHLIK